MAQKKKNTGKRIPKTKGQLLFQRRCEEVAAKNIVAFMKGDMNIDELVKQVSPTLRELKEKQQDK